MFLSNFLVTQNVLFNRWLAQALQFAPRGSVARRAVADCPGARGGRGAHRAGSPARRALDSVRTLERRLVFVYY